MRKQNFTKRIHLFRDQEVAGSSPVIQTKVKIKHLRIFESACFVLGREKPGIMDIGSP